MKPLAVGDRVAVTREFLESSVVERQYRYAWSRRRGVIVALTDKTALALATVQWEGEAEPRVMNVGNLCRVRSVAFVETTQRDKQ